MLVLKVLTLAYICCNFISHQIKSLMTRAEYLKKHIKVNIFSLLPCLLWTIPHVFLFKMIVIIMFNNGYC